ncbi:MAG: hypothetical protein AB8B53_03135 [Flavobacteriales bacterium]
MKFFSLLFTLFLCASQWNTIATQTPLLSPENADIVVILRGDELLNKVALEEMKDMPFMSTFFNEISGMLGQGKTEIDQLGINLDSEAQYFLTYEEDGSMNMGASFEVNDPDLYKSVFMAETDIQNEAGVFFSVKEGYTRALRGNSGLITYSVLPRNSGSSMNYYEDDIYIYDDTEVMEYEAIEEEAYEAIPEAEEEYEITEEMEVPAAPELDEDIVEVPPPPPPPPGRLSNEYIYENEPEPYDYEAERKAELEQKNAEIAIKSKALALELMSSNSSGTKFSENQIKSDADFSILVNNYGSWVKSLMPGGNSYYRSSFDIQMEQWLYNVYGNVEWLSMNGFYEKDAFRVEMNSKISDDLSEFYSKSLDREFNTDMLNYIPFEDHLMFTSGAFNTKEMLNGYYDYTRTLMEDFPDELTGNEPVGEYVSIFLDFMEMVVDESAIADLMKGDYYAGITNFSSYEMEYTTYEYDDDWNYSEITKTKEEVRPDFLCMFSSDDSKNINNIFKLVSLGSRGEFSLQDGGYYKLASSEFVPLDIYALQKDGIVFIFSSQRLFDFIQDGGAKPTLEQKNLLTSNSSVMRINSSRMASKVPLNELPSDAQRAVEFLEANAGDVQLTSGKVKNGMITTELNMMVKGKHKNSLAYFLSVMDSMYKIEKENSSYRN